VAVYAYMTAPIVERFGLDWLERGSMQVKFHQPFYEGEMVVVSSVVEADAAPVRVAITAARDDGAVCATALATVNDRSAWLGEPDLKAYPLKPLPAEDDKPLASLESMAPGTLLGSLSESIAADPGLLESLSERLPIYRGADAVAHPYSLLALSNYILMRNYTLGPWIHAASDIINCGGVRVRDQVSVRGRIKGAFEKKGHEFVVVDLLLAVDERIVQQVRHTAIYRPRLESRS
jgi:hypothetical protein